MWGGIELRDLETVLVLAEELHFGRTAARLGVSTSHVSQRIGSVERRLKGRLFERTSRRVVTTLLGQALVRDIGPLIGALDNSLAAAAGRAAGLTGTLRVGHIVTVDGSAAVARLIERFHQMVPAVTVRRLRVDTFDYVEALHRGDTDIWLSWWPEPAPDADPETGLRCGPPIDREHPAFLVGRNHPLACRSSIGLNDLVEHPVVAMPDIGPVLFRRHWIPTTAPNGHPIARAPAPEWHGHFHELAPVLERGQLGWLTIATFLETVAMPPGLTTVPIRDAPDFVIVPWWEAARESPLITEFVALGSELAIEAYGRA